MIKVVDIVKSFSSIEVLRSVSLSVEEGEMVAIVGASGAGKTTLLQIMGTLLRADSGSVYIDGKDVTSMSERTLAQFRNRNIGFVFQSHHLLPEFNALENVMMPALIGGTAKKDALSRAEELLSMVNLQNRTTHYPSQLSGGEQQRVAIARALMNRPKVILADEPTGNLDSENRNSIQALLKDISRNYSQTIVTVTHDEQLALQADRKITLQDGRIL